MSQNIAPVAVFFVFIALICVIAIFLLTVNGQQENAENFSYYLSAQTPPLTTLHETELMAFTFEQLAEISNGYLFLVNKSNGVPPIESPMNLVNVSDFVWTLNGDIQMSEDALVMLQKMFSSAAEIDFTQFRVTEGFRTFEHQQMLYDTATDKSLVALPGHSEHQSGLAADISYHGVNIGNSRQGTWLMNNSYRYGFILRYPQHKTEITGLPFEPWHYRYVGQPHAYFMQSKDFVLEEYIDFLLRHREIKIIFGGLEYSVHYLLPGEIIEIPHSHSMSASLDNTGGIIVTSWHE